MVATWPDHVVNDLKALAARGLSASQCASHFNGMTRNAAVGLGFRNKFQFHGAQGGGAPKGPSPSRPPRTLAPEPAIELAPLMLTFQELNFDGDCRYIYGDVQDSAHRYCGLPALSGGSWCQSHAKIVYVPPEERRRAHIR